MKDIYVVGAAIIKDGKILCTKRSEDRILGTLWEFPGGKIESSETPRDAIKREIKEELGASILVGKQVADTEKYEYPFGIVHLTVFYAQFTEESYGQVAHSDMRWMMQSSLHDLTWAPADLSAVEEIKSSDLSKLSFI